MENSIFRVADAAEHAKILKSEREIFWVRILSTSFILILALGAILTFELKMHSGIKEIDHTWEEADYLIGFNETEESVLKELYGDFEEKADSLVWQDKSQFLDKEATAATGEMTYDEAAMEQYRREVIAEMESQIDYDRVRSVLEERKSAYRESKKQEMETAKTAAASSPEKQKSTIYLILFLVGEAAAFIACSVRYKCIRDKAYSITDGVIVEKRVQLRSDVILARRLVISYQDGKQIVVVTLLQTLRMHKGDKVYLIKTNLPFRPFKICEQA